MSGVAFPKAVKTLPVYIRLSELKRLFRSLELCKHRFALRNEMMFKMLVTFAVSLYFIDLILQNISIYRLSFVDTCT
jgi:hypothetical protein